MQALRLYAGPAALRWIGANGLQPADIRAVAAAAGGPKGLILGPLDRFLFGQWLPLSRQPVDLVGASIGAWRMATACLDDSVSAFERLERDYIAQHYELEPGRTRPSPETVSELFGDNLLRFYGPRAAQVLAHPRYRLHVMTSRGRHVLRREHGLGTPLGYLGAFLTNTVHRRAMGSWLERVVFSTPGAALPFLATDYRTRQVSLSQANFHPALQASCSIPFVLRAVHNIPGAPPGAYWDGGITDYHLHLNYAGLPARQAARAGRETASAAAAERAPGIVLYPHFQRAVVPGWLDKQLPWRHKATHFLDNVLLLAPDPEWVGRLPGGKLPDRTDFVRYGRDLPGRITAWDGAARASAQLADEFAQWLLRPDVGRVAPL